MRHIHLDPLGGAAGDMFVAAMLDAFPEHRDAVIAAAQSLAGVACRLVAHDDGTLTGQRFEVDEASPDVHGHVHHHDHTHWQDIRTLIEMSALPPEVQRHTIGIFTALAEAEAKVHGVAPDEVAFHEVGAADSIADIVATAWMIAAVSPATWSTAALPMGGGQVRTAHGLMPVPAPATALLLEGFAMHDDGVSGERVTPTGAAILRYLDAAGGRRPSGVVRQSGFGFGTRRLPGVSNCLRVLVLETEDVAQASGHRELAVVSFEVDDQSGEELAAGLERIRGMEAVHDVVQMAAFGKKSRFAVHVQVLARPDALDEVVEACFRETTTIGLRTHLVQGRALARRFATVAVAEQEVRVKLVERPGGATGKAEADDIGKVATHAARTRLRRAAETGAETA